MKILITGGAGFIGSAVVRLAITRGHCIINLDALTYAASLESLASISDHPNYLFIKMNIQDNENLGALFSKHKPDVVMHLAAESHVDRSIDRPCKFYRNQHYRYLQYLGGFTQILARKRLS